MKNDPNNGKSDAQSRGGESETDLDRSADRPGTQSSVETETVFVESGTSITYDIVGREDDPGPDPETTRDQGAAGRVAAGIIGTTRENRSDRCPTQGNPRDHERQRDDTSDPYSGATTAMPRESCGGDSAQAGKQNQGVDDINKIQSVGGSLDLVVAHAIIHGVILGRSRAGEWVTVRDTAEIQGRPSGYVLKAQILDEPAMHSVLDILRELLPDELIVEKLKQCPSDIIQIQWAVWRDEINASTARVYSKSAERDREVAR